jgi:hypothetical protein
MKKSRFTEQQIALSCNRRSGPVAEMCREMGISEAT